MIAQTPSTTPGSGSRELVIDDKLDKLVVHNSFAYLWSSKPNLAISNSQYNSNSSSSSTCMSSLITRPGCFNVSVN